MSSDLKQSETVAPLTPGTVVSSLKPDGTITSLTPGTVVSSLKPNGTVAPLTPGTVLSSLKPDGAVAPLKAAGAVLEGGACQQDGVTPPQSQPKLTKTNG